MKPSYFLTFGEQRGYERRLENRRRFFERRLRAAAIQTHTHLSIMGRHHLPAGNQALAIEMAVVRHRWSWQRP